MTTRTVKLVGPDCAVVATAQVTYGGRHYAGTVDLRATPAGLRALFEELEEVVNGQMLSFVDDIQGKIAAHSLHAIFDDGSEVGVGDLQVFPGTGDISFQVASVPVEAVRVGSIAPARLPADSPATAPARR